MGMPGQPGGRQLRYAFKLLCPPLLVDKLRANDLKELERIEEQTHSTIRLSYESELYPETRHHIMSVRASEPAFLRDAVSFLTDEVMAKGLEEDGVSGEDFMMSDGQIVIRCVLPSQAIDAMRGEGGDDLQRIGDDTGASLTVDQEYDGCRLVVVSGDRQQLSVALEELISAVERHMDEDWFLAWAEQLSIAGPASSNGPRPSRRRGHDTEEHRGCTIFVGHLSQATTKHRLAEYFAKYGEVLDSDVRLDPESRRSKGFGFITFADSGAVSDCIRDAADHHIDGRWVDVKPYDPKPEGGGKDGGKGSSKGKSSEKGKGERSERGREKGGAGAGKKGGGKGGNVTDWRDEWASEAAPRRDYSEKRDYREDRDWGDRGRSEWSAGRGGNRHRSREPEAKRRRRGDSRQRSPPAAAPSSSSTHNNHHSYYAPTGVDKFPEDVQWLSKILLEVKPEFAGLDYSLSCFLPSKKCGPLIGPGGRTVGEVQKRTGATVDISKNSAPDCPDTREVKITGSLLNVYAAHALLMQVYNEEEAIFQARSQGHREAGREHHSSSSHNGNSYYGSHASNGRDNYNSSSSTRRSSYDNPDVQDLKRQMEEIQQKLDHVAADKDRHAYPSSRRDGYGSYGSHSSHNRDYSSNASSKGGGGGKGKWGSSEGSSKGGGRGR